MIFKKIYQEVLKIPSGKVATYGQVARLAKIADARVVGWALHGNKDPNIPCYRVVSREGKLAPNYVFGGWKKQKEKLLEEEVVFDKNRVDLKRSLWKK